MSGLPSHEPALLKPAEFLRDFCDIGSARRMNRRYGMKFVC